MARFLAAFPLIAFMASSAVRAVPITLARDVFLPPITNPNEQTVWHINDKQNVTWNASNPPQSISNRASIVLRSDFTSENQIQQRTLARDFSLLSGTQEIQVPNDLETRDDYVIVLFGDSGNASPPFKIIGNDYGANY